MTTDPDPDIADYLAGEMADDRRHAFEDRLAEDPALAAEVAGLERTLGALETAGPLPAARGFPAAGPRRLLPLAAAAGIAFAAGFLAHAVLSPAASPPPATTATAPGATDDDAPDVGSPDMPDRLAQAYRESGAESPLARGLIALARSRPAPSLVPDDVEP